MGNQAVDLISFKLPVNAGMLFDHVGQFRPLQNVQRNRQTGLLCWFLDLQQASVRASGQTIIIPKNKF